ncbi:hypothetical protein EW145_g2304 [Phellinidium pouzarii]|uniref:Uncharacterized protein n=1 Tax=Phellinidium pouzarii TaxID=167371 RepID=A0A4S4LGU1_9AGAM|nr:hypothetical protein EW145_g2304 [Phellinidium pouzarii]
MTGANYMGGRRNAARARTKDIASRVQKGHFSKQRHQILVQGLQDGIRVDKVDRAVQPGCVGDINLAHAKKDIQGKHSLRSRAAIAPRTLSQSLLQSSSSPEKPNHHKRSRILESLDINEPTALRATVDRLLRLPNFAGLTRSNASNARTTPRNSQTLPTSVESPRKRQKTSQQSLEVSSPVLLHESSCRKGSPPSIAKKERSLHLMADLPSAVKNPSLLPVFTHNSAASKRSDSLMDCISTMQEGGTDYQDSGFSELEFVDEPDPENTISDIFIQGSNSIRQDLCSGSLSSSSFSSSITSSNSRNFPSAAPKMFESSMLSSNDKCQSLRKAESPAVLAFSSNSLYLEQSSSPQMQQVSLLDFSDPWRALDNILGLPPSKSDNDLLEGINANDRSGVGYKPLQANVSNSSFQHTSSRDSSELPTRQAEPLSENILQDVKCNLSGASNLLAYGLADNQRQSSSSDLNLPPLPLAHYAVFATPPRRSNFSPTSATRIVPRPRFFLNVYNSVSDILNSTENDQNIGVSKNTSRFSARFSSPVAGPSSVVASPSMGRPRLSSLVGHPLTTASARHYLSRRSAISEACPLSPHLQEPSVSSTVLQMLSTHDPPTRPISPFTLFPKPHPAGNAPGDVANQTSTELVTIDGPDLFEENDDDE